MYQVTAVHGEALQSNPTAARAVEDQGKRNNPTAELSVDLVCAVQSVRQKLYDELTKINKDRDWSFILHQIGECPQLGWQTQPGQPDRNAMSFTILLGVTHNY